ncbi:ATP-dependent Clp endopeptidase, proteolytic subunit ClpP [Geodermatophilus pulveris]|uniref:ATP-dependent Clp protease proteolytic subunit n=1 Tax=Geodermatophilus pulveris TaxID=1564159 RepID=A0A239ICA0_9ACTN|nr:ATP-dependent Clp protease proteolytic subunit [Geodermatophilus pulveris]SNS91191.1 ATP-dependent Clp endopeptidase, proteolytic subunit ClpP [Geodermatophilus pulveris]
MPVIPMPTTPDAARLSGAGGHASLTDAVFDRLLRERIVFLDRQVDDDVANQLCAQMLLLAADDARSDIHLHINSPGGSVSAGMAVYDRMQFLDCDVATCSVGMRLGAGRAGLLTGRRPWPPPAPGCSSAGRRRPRRSGWVSPSSAPASHSA